MRFTCACRACEETVVTAERPAAPIDKGRPGPGLLAQVITAKYADHVPLNRLVDIFGRYGVTLARQTLCDWVATAAALLTCVCEDLKTLVIGSAVIHTDDTIVPVQDRERSQTRDGRLWVYVGDGHQAETVYDLHRRSQSRWATGLPRLSAGRRYAGYDALYATNIALCSARTAGRAPWKLG